MNKTLQRIFFFLVDAPLSRLIVQPTFAYYNRKTLQNPRDPKKNGDVLLLRRIVEHIHAPFHRKTADFITRPGVALTTAVCRLLLRFGSQESIDMHPIAQLVQFETDNRRNGRPPSSIFQAVKTPTVDEMYGR